METGTIALLHAAATLAMCGVIWFVQVAPATLALRMLHAIRRGTTALPRICSPKHR